MVLVIDIGNTNTVIGIFEDKNIVNHWRIKTDKDCTTDEIVIMLKQLFEIGKIDCADIEGVVISNVVPPLSYQFKRAIEGYFAKKVLFVEPGIKTGISINYDNPREVGSDRIVNAVAAYNLFKCGVVVVDFGTAVTFDCVSPNGEYLGGLIYPGIKISLDALIEKTAKLPKVDIVIPKRIVGKNTVESIQAGIFYGYIAMVDGIIERLKKELPFQFKVISTGGFTNLIASHSKYIEESDPLLTLKGLKIIYDLNVSGKKKK